MLCEHILPFRVPGVLPPFRTQVVGLYQSHPSRDPRHVIAQRVDLLPHHHCPEHAPVFVWCFVVLTPPSTRSPFSPRLSLVLWQTHCYFLHLRKGETVSGPHPLPLGPLPLAAAAPLLSCFSEQSSSGCLDPQSVVHRTAPPASAPRSLRSHGPQWSLCPPKRERRPSLLAFSNPSSASSHHSSQIIVPSCHLF